MVRAIEQTRKNRHEVFSVKMTLFFCENFILGLCGHGVRNGLFEGDAAFMFFISQVSLKNMFLYFLYLFQICLIVHIIIKV